MNILEFHIPEEILVALSLLILILVLGRIFWKPVMKVIEERQSGIDAALKSAEDSKNFAAELDKKYENQSAELDKLIAEKTKTANDNAQSEFNRIIDEAKDRAKHIVASAEAKAVKEHQKMLHDAQDEIVTLAMTAAGKVVQTSMDTETNREIVRNFLTQQDAEKGVSNV